MWATGTPATPLTNEKPRAEAQGVYFTHKEKGSTKSAAFTRPSIVAT